MDLKQIMSFGRLGVDVIISSSIEENPACVHGPSILFERFQEGGQSRRFYACSACRDRRDCSFFHWAHIKMHKNKKEIWQRLIRESQPSVSHQQLYNRLEVVRGMSPGKRHYCTSCCCLLTNDEDKSKHNEDCSFITPVTDIHLSHPSTVLPPKESSKYEAQYLFAEGSVCVLVDMLVQLGITRTLCVGAPRIHEAITPPQYHSNNTSSSTSNTSSSTSNTSSSNTSSSTSPHATMDSLMLDIDNRYCSFFSPDEFIRYNMFNHHFFDGDEAKQTYLNFIGQQDAKLAVVCDPPFGGRMELLAHNLNRIQEDWRNTQDLDNTHILPMLFIFPYFMEQQVLSSLPTFTMLDYQVDYDNHPLYSSGPKGMKNGSAVRVFTNQPASKFVLPESEGYRFCPLCRRWVAINNTHCDKCNGCMAKDGRTYKHCDQCDKCVKPSWIHCNTCTRCQPPDHTCHPLLHHSSTQPPTCNKCGATGHKRSLCHKRMKTTIPLEQKKKKKKKDNYPQSLEEERKRNLSILEELT
ncbi:hypothetical protein Pmani_014129 [Petrolisthes manimaculis]|uniref:Zinc finger CCHC domain-containing protein 4 n=1 Tax=Petrolisthes manimaculis TaxID=1843537 RepID=A0AAE1PUT4_9EUCA|nr:hypothetical protein Pmani_014129 [Petrolisthes manimaculis]